MPLIPPPVRRRLPALLASWGGIVAAALGVKGKVVRTITPVPGLPPPAPVPVDGPPESTGKDR